MIKCVGLRRHQKACIMKDKNSSSRRHCRFPFQKNNATQVKGSIKAKKHSSLCFYIMYHKKFGKDGLMEQVVCCKQSVPGCARTGLKEHLIGAPSRCSLLVPLRLPVQPLPGGSEGLVQDYCFASTHSMRRLIPPASLVSPSSAHATEQILGSQTEPPPPGYQKLMRGRYWYSPPDTFASY